MDNSDTTEGSLGISRIRESGGGEVKSTKEFLDLFEAPSDLLERERLRRSISLGFMIEATILSIDSLGGERRSCKKKRTVNQTVLTVPFE